MSTFKLKNPSKSRAGKDRRAGRADGACAERPICSKSSLLACLSPPLPCGLTHSLLWSLLPFYGLDVWYMGVFMCACWPMLLHVEVGVRVGLPILDSTLFSQTRPLTLLARMLTSESKTFLSLLCCPSAGVTDLLPCLALTWVLWTLTLVFTPVQQTLLFMSHLPSPVYYELDTDGHQCNYPTGNKIPVFMWTLPHSNKRIQPMGHVEML